MINVLTYNYPHKKTQYLLFRLIAKDYRNVSVFSTPWIERKSLAFQGGDVDDHESR